tara:strand:+ start:3453 stop:4031 length:579 start_codon:yes stop_codon:yes gene_type:complete
MKLEIIIIISYLLGSIPFGFLLTKIFLNKDIRKIGSGNIGATNALRTGNKTLGYATLILDILKAIIPLIFVKIYYSEYLYISSLCVFLGHVFPVWLKFKGGKGVATYVGILCCINIYLGIGFGMVWLITFVIFKYSSLSSLIGALSIPIINFLFFNNQIFYFFIIMFILIFYTHRENIKRLLNRTESKSKIY